jgi:transposase
MVVLADDGKSISEIARKCGTSRARVRAWLKRFRDGGMRALHDRKRSGRPRRITSLERHRVIAAACQAPGKFGIERVLWSHQGLSDALSACGSAIVSASTIGRILAEAQIKPHRVKMWCHSNDPLYQQKMRDIVSLYTDPPPFEPVLCIDEKSGMQALSRPRPITRPGPGSAARFGFEYRRNGTRCLFACFNIRTGQVLGRCTEQRRREDFFAFMDLVAALYRQPRVHIVLDNLNTHHDTSKGAFVTEWNRRHGNRFVFHYTPTHGSWLNQVELWFGILTRRVLRYGNFRTPAELTGTVERFIRQWNDTEAHPFRWTYDGTPLAA